MLPSVSPCSNEFRYTPQDKIGASPEKYWGPRLPRISAQMQFRLSTAAGSVGV